MAISQKLEDQLQLLRYSDLVGMRIVKNRMTLRTWIETAGFPKPIRLGGNSLAWRADQVAAWLARRAVKSKTEVF